MNRRLLPFAGVILAILALYFLVFRKKETADLPKPEPIAATTTDGFTTKTTAALAAYYNLKDAFVKSDTNAVNAAAAAFLPLVDALDVQNIKAEAPLLQMAGEFKQTISSETKNIPAVAGIDDKRRNFQLLSDAMFDLLRTVKYSDAKVYQQYCPMAFDNSGAAWLSNSNEVINPYFGDKMLNCGEVRDSLRNK